MHLLCFNAQSWTWAWNWGQTLRFVNNCPKWPHKKVKSYSEVNLPKMPYGYQIWSEELKTKVKHIAGVKDHTGVIPRMSISGHMLRNGLWLPNLFRWTPHRSVIHCWGQRSCRSHLRSTRGQFALKCPSLVGGTPTYCWGQRSHSIYSESVRCQFAKECSMSSKFGQYCWTENNISLMSLKTYRCYSALVVYRLGQYCWTENNISLMSLKTYRCYSALVVYRLLNCV